MDGADPTDEELMLRLEGGDDLALNALMERWERPLISFITRYTKDQNDGLDLAQETFVRVYESRARYRAKGKFSTWMFAIAVNLCRNRARWKARHPTVSLTAGDEDGDGRARIDSVPDPAELPDSGAARAEDGRRIREAVQALPHNLRAAVLLSEFEGMSQAQIARVLGCTSKAVESRLYRARQLLRDRLKDLAPRN